MNEFERPETPQTLCLHLFALVWLFWCLVVWLFGCLVGWLVVRLFVCSFVAVAVAVVCCC